MRKSKEIYELFLYFALAAFLVYYTPVAVRNIAFVGFLVAIVVTKKDYFWLAFLFVIINEPAGIFRGGSSELSHRIPLFTLFQGVSLSFYDLVILLFFLKSFNSKTKPVYFFSKPFKFLGILSIFLILYSILLGMSVSSLTGVIRGFGFYSLLFSIPRLIKSEEELVQFFRLIFPFVFLVVFGQFFEFIYGSPFVEFLDPAREKIVLVWEGQIRPQSDGTMIVFFSLVFAFYLSAGKKNIISESYLQLIIGFCLASVIMSATRSWIAMFFILVLYYTFFIKGANIKYLFSLSILVIVMGIFYITIPEFQRLIDGGLDRFSTVEFLLKGDITAGGTVKRFDVRLPKVMTGFWENPILGWGFSQTFDNFADAHVGNFNLLLQVGVLGFFFFAYLWSFTFRRIKIASLNCHPEDQEAVRSLGLGLFGMLILHFTSYQFFYFNNGNNQNFDTVFIVFYYSIINVVVYHSLRRIWPKQPNLIPGQ